MASEPKQQNPYPYATPEEPRNLSDDDLSLLSQYTGEKDLEKLRAHVLTIWRNVKSKLWVYACVQRLMFLHPRITGHEFYAQALDTIKSAPDSIFLDIGCCFGQDTRQLILDGVPAQSVTATDITPDYWEFGKYLFMDRDTLAVQSAFGSFTDPEFTAATGPLGHLSGRVAFAWAGAVLHVLSAEDVRAFATHVHAVLAPGGVWFGTCVGSEPPGDWAPTPNGKGRRYLHSPSSLQSLLEHIGFSQVEVVGSVNVDGARMQDGIEDNGTQKVMLSYTARK
ncbi:probableBRG0 Methyltransferase adrK [Coccomyxa sp. Obi]|nr:probableBRG0 Methyltransferase adrK [Coccomyxa sp. Obi]